MSEESAKPRFVGFGVGTYDNALLIPTKSVLSVRNVCDVLGDGFERRVVENPTEEAARRELRAFDGMFDSAGGQLRQSDEILVVMWSGHGLSAPGNGGVRLFARDSKPNAISGLTPADVVGPCAMSGASQVLLVLEACFSGGSLPVIDVASWLLDQRPDGGQNAWFGVLTACRSAETAQDGILAERICALLRDGPRGDDLKHRWNAHNRLIRGDDLWDALIKEWPLSVEQLPDFRPDGNALGMLPNPLWVADAPPRVVEHLLLAARGDVDGDRSWFSGRMGEVDRVVSWVKSRTPGIRVITGSAGTGKSAILGRVVSASAASEREKLLAQGPLGHADPEAGSVTAHVLARGHTANQLARELGSALAAASPTLAPLANADTAARLSAAVEQLATEQGPAWQPPVVAVDGLDEAHGQAFAIASNLLVRLGHWMTVIVATRPLPARGDDADLLGSLAPLDTIDLDDPEWRTSGQQALIDYIVDRLSGVSDAMDASVISDYLLRETDLVADQPFLLARLTTSQLRSDPVDTAEPDWISHVNTTVGDAFRQDLLAVADGGADLSRAEILLTALTWGVGIGVPEDIWMEIANTIAPVGVGIDRDDVSWVLDNVGRHIVEDGDEGVAVFRMAHQALADELNPRFEPDEEAPFDPDAAPVAIALLDYYDHQLDSGRSAASHSYLWFYAWRHAALAGPVGVERLRSLAVEYPILRLDLAMACAEVSQTLSSFGHYSDAITPTEEALRLYRELDDASAIGGTLVQLGTCYAQTGRLLEATRLTAQAVEIFRAGGDVDQPGLALTLLNLGNNYAQVGETDKAISTSEEGVDVFRALVDEDPDFRAGLAMTLANLGWFYAIKGRTSDAMPLAEESVDIYRQLEVEDEGDPSGFAIALTNLGMNYANSGRIAEAITVSEEAAQIYRTALVGRTTALPGYAIALLNLGMLHGRMGRQAEATTSTEQAVEVHRRLVAISPIHLGGLAMALTNLCNLYAATGDLQRAVPAAEEAVHIYRIQAAANPVYRPGLALGLINLGFTRSQADRVGGAVIATREAVSMWRKSVMESPIHRSSLAMGELNLAGFYGQLGMHDAALALTRDAMDLSRVISQETAAGRNGLALALIHSSVRFGEMRRYDEAAAHAEEGLNIYRALAAEDPAQGPNLSLGLYNLSTCYLRVHRHPEAIRLATEAVATSEALAEPIRTPRLAASLSSLSAANHDAGNVGAAVASAEKAVEIALGMVRDNPGGIQTLAEALDNLERACGSDERWNQCLDTLSAHRGPLLHRRLVQATEGRPEAPAWAHRALSALSGDAERTAAVRHQARRHRKVDPTRFDAAYTSLTGDPPPDWLTVDPVTAQSALTWLMSETIAKERDWLNQHPEILNDSADVAVNEALLRVGEHDAAQCREIRIAARNVGVSAAYRPFELKALAMDFISGDHDQQAALLEERADDLRDPLVTSYLDRAGDDPQFRIARDLIELSRTGDHVRVLAALGGAVPIGELLAGLTVDADPAIMKLAASVTGASAQTEEDHGISLFYGGLAHARCGEVDAARDDITAARQLMSGHVSDWINVAAGLTDADARLLVIKLLTTPIGQESL